ncbi:MAG: M20/M25/M40 family metallo-hydrolase, partial [Casimicrobium sp.]
GAQANDSLITQVGVRSAQHFGVKEPFTAASSTDSNTPIALGIPALTLGGGGIGGGSHSPGEWYSPLNAWLGPQNALLVTLALTGVDGVSEPLLVKRGR